MIEWKHVSDHMTYAALKESSAVSRSSVYMLQFCLQMIVIRISSIFCAELQLRISTPKHDMAIIWGEWNALVGHNNIIMLS